MSFTNIGERWIGSKIEVVPDGTNIGTVEAPSIVSKTVKPAEDATWNAWHFGDVISVKPDHRKKTISREFYSRAANSYIDRENERITQARYVATMKDFSSLHDQLAHGLAAAPVNGTPQSPFATTDCSVNGWIRMTRKNDDGTVIAELIYHGKVDLPDLPEDKNEYGSPTYRFAHLKDADSAMESYTPFPDEE